LVHARQREAAVSVKLARRFAACDLGQKFKTGGEELTVVGWFEGGDSAFDSKCGWMPTKRARFSTARIIPSVLVRVGSTNAAAALIKRIESDKRMPLRADLETDYYSKQTMTALPIRILGQFLATAMSIGAIFAAMNTMYASVGARTREIGTLRVLGFRRRTILASFNLEGAILASLGGLIGCGLALLAQYLCVALGVRFGTSASTRSAKSFFSSASRQRW